MTLLRFSATIRDAFGTEVSTVQQISISDASSLTTVDSEFTTWYQALDACTDGKIIRANWASDSVAVSGIKTAPLAGSRVEQTGMISFSAVGSARRYSFPIPALSNDSTVLVGDRIVLAGGDPIALLVHLLTVASGGVAYCNGHSQTIEAFTDAFVVSRKYRKQLQRSSFEV